MNLLHFEEIGWQKKYDLLSSWEQSGWCGFRSVIRWSVLGLWILQCLVQGFHYLIHGGSVLRILLQAAICQVGYFPSCSKRVLVIETSVDDGAEPATVGRIMFNPFYKLLFSYWTVSIQCTSPCQDLIKHHTKTPNITLNFQMTRLNILWGSISLCPHYLISFQNDESAF